MSAKRVHVGGDVPAPPTCRIARCRSGRDGSDCTPHCSQRRPIIERNSAKGFYTKLIPKSCQIALNRLRFHLLVELCQHRNPCCFIAEHQRAFKRPTGFDITAASEDRPQRVLQAAAIACALVYLYIRHQAGRSRSR